MRQIPPRVTSTRPTVAWCLELHDLVLSKCVANRQRDWDYARAALAAGIVGPDVLLSRVYDLPVAEDVRCDIDKQLRSIINM